MPDRSVPPPIPDEAYAAAQRRTGELIDYWELSPAGYKLDEDDPADVETPVDVVVGEIVDAAAPAILEDRVEAVAEALYRADRGGAWCLPWAEVDEAQKGRYRELAREALGIPAPDRKEGE